MKKLILVILLLVSTIGLAQFPIIEEFNLGTTWVYTNGAGMQNYGTAENYATFNVGGTPYLDNSSITITSPVYNLSTCLSGLSVVFPLNGIIDNTVTNDIVYFQYRIGLGIWITVATYTGVQGSIYTYNTIPNTATQFRFLLITDASLIWWYKPSFSGGHRTTSSGSYIVPVDVSNEYVSGGSVNVYYYDIANFTIKCTGVLPIELIEFSGKQDGNYNLLSWITASEINNEYFTVEKSKDANNFIVVGNVNGAGNSTSELSYSLEDETPYDGISYYRLKQTDYNGETKIFNIISVSRMNTGKDLKVIKIINLLGQEVNDDYDGIKIYYFNDGSAIKKYKIK